MKMNRLFLLIFVLITQSIFSSTTLAVEPPRELILEAIEKGKTAFLARATKTEQVKRNKAGVIAEATLEILHCIYGAGCVAKKDIKIKYHVQTVLESTIPIQIPLGTDMVFVLNQNLNSMEYFDSEWRGGIDRAFICDNFPFDFLNFKEEVRCKNIYGGKITSWVKWNEFATIKGSN